MRATINRVGKYELKAVLARTALSTVYDGWDCDIARRVAIKAMPLSTADDDEAKEALTRFKRGAQAAGQLNHPNIVAVYDYGETADFAYLVMEFIDGPTLKALFDNNQRFSLPDIGNIIGSVLDALQYSHDRRVVHRDMKPANVMFTQNNVVKITDFGIARLEDSEMTQAGMVIGTPAYMSPEQFLGERIDWRTDIYSAGVLLYQILTGERPYEGTLATIMHKVLYGAPLLPSRLSTLVTPAVDQVVTRAMARRREDRFESAAEFKAELLNALGGPGGRDRAAVPPSRVRLSVPRPSAHTVSRQISSVVSSSRSRQIMLGSLAALVIVAGGAVAWHMRSQSTAPDPGSRLAETTVALGGPVTNVPVTQPSPPAAAVSSDTAPSVAPPAEPSVPPAPKAEQREAALPPFQEDFANQPSRPDARPDAVEPPQYAAPVEPPASSAPYYPPAPKYSPPERKPAPVPNAARQPERNPVAGAPDRRAPAAEPKSARNAPEPNNRPTQSNEQGNKGEKDSTAEALNRLREGLLRPPPPVEPPPAYPTTSINGAIGLVCQSITAEMAEKLGLDNARGMVVTGVTNGSAAARAGIRSQDIILKINGSDVRDLSIVSKLAKEGSARTVPVEIFRSGGTHVVQLQID